MYDIIGDIHGHAQTLIRLLERLEFDRHRGWYSHPKRKVIFCGDFIDRGPEIAGVLDIVRPMIDAGAAFAVMGNHELNAIAYHTRCPNGSFARPHSEPNVHQHWQTLHQLSPEALRDAIRWFRTLPMWLELDGLRVVHACWNAAAIETISQSLDEHRDADGHFSDEWITRAYTQGDPIFDAIEKVLKGPDLKLPGGRVFHDKDGKPRKRGRTRWFVPTANLTLGEYYIDSSIPNLTEPVEDVLGRSDAGYPSDAPPVFFGHYWMRGTPRPLASNVACLDYSVARDGELVAYRWDGETTLDAKKFVRIPAE